MRALNHFHENFREIDFTKTEMDTSEFSIAKLEAFDFMHRFLKKLLIWIFGAPNSKQQLDNPLKILEIIWSKIIRAL